LTRRRITLKRCISVAPFFIQSNFILTKHAGHNALTAGLSYSEGKEGARESVKCQRVGRFSIFEHDCADEALGSGA
jgi:hypothetical protein